MLKEESQAFFFERFKTIKPQIIVSGRIGNELGDYVQMEDNSLPKTRQESAWEVPVSMNHTWAYKRDDNHWKITKYQYLINHSVHEWKLSSKYWPKRGWLYTASKFG